MRIGSSEIAPFGGSTVLSSVDEIASVRILASSGEIMAAGIVVLTPLVAVLVSIDEDRDGARVRSLRRVVEIGRAQIN
jgi:hypothetical protein